jgi:hypothetical protein
MPSLLSEQFLVQLEHLFMNALRRSEMGCKNVVADIAFRFAKLHRLAGFVPDFQDVFLTLSQYLPMLREWL